MKLLYTIHQFYPEFHSGTERFLLNLCSSLQRDGHTVDVVTYSFQEQGSRTNGQLLVRDYFYKGIPVTAVRHVRVPIDIHSSWGSPEIADFAYNVLRKSKPDLVHVAHPMRLTAFVDVARELSIPYVMTLTDFWTICPKINLQTSSGAPCTGPEDGAVCAQFCAELDRTFVKERLHRANMALHGARAVVGPSKFVRSVLRKEVQSLQPKVIPHGIDRKYVFPGKGRHGSEDNIVFAYCGGLSPHKGVHLLLRAFRRLDQGNCALRIYGGHFEQPDYYASLLELAGDDKRILFCGLYSEEQGPEILREIDVLVVPSLVYETYSLITHEALASGVPVIASRAGALDEAIENSVTGFTFTMGNEDELLAQFERVLADSEALNRIRIQLRSYVPWLIEEEAYQYQRLYRSVLSRGKVDTSLPASEQLA